MLREPPFNFAKLLLQCKLLTPAENPSIISKTSAATEDPKNPEIPYSNEPNYRRTDAHNTGKYALPIALQIPYSDFCGSCNVAQTSRNAERHKNLL